MAKVYANQMDFYNSISNPLDDPLVIERLIKIYSKINSSF